MRTRMIFRARDHHTTRKRRGDDCTYGESDSYRGGSLQTHNNSLSFNEVRRNVVGFVESQRDMGGDMRVFVGMAEAH